jgi:hypothetical protein
MPSLLPVGLVAHPIFSDQSTPCPASRTESMPSDDEGDFEDAEEDEIRAPTPDKRLGRSVSPTLERMRELDMALAIDAMRASAQRHPRRAGDGPSRRSSTTPEVSPREADVDVRAPPSVSLKLQGVTGTSRQGDEAVTPSASGGESPAPRFMDVLSSTESSASVAGGGETSERSGGWLMDRGSKPARRRTDGDSSDEISPLGDEALPRLPAVRARVAELEGIAKRTSTSQG